MIFPKMMFKGFDLVLLAPIMDSTLTPEQCVQAIKQVCANRKLAWPPQPELVTMMRDAGDRLSKVAAMIEAERTKTNG